MASYQRAWPQEIPQTLCHHTDYVRHYILLWNTSFKCIYGANIECIPSSNGSKLSHGRLRAEFCIHNLIKFRFYFHPDYSEYHWNVWYICWCDWFKIDGQKKDISVRFNWGNIIGFGFV